MMKRKTLLGYLIASLIILGAWLQTDLTNGYLQLDEVEDPYQITTQEEIHQKIETLKQENTYTQNHMLMIYNPYGTNTLGMYVYFQSEEAVTVSYTIHVDDLDVNDFTRKLSDTFTYEHEYQLIGLVPKEANTIIFTFMKEDGTSTTYETTVYINDVRGSEPYHLDITEGNSTQYLSNGLYVIFGNDDEDGDNFMYLYDNDGVLRSEIPISDIRSHRLIFHNDLMYFSNSTSQIAAMNALGQIVNVYDLGSYSLHHDYILDQNNLLVLATDTQSNTVQDQILSIDLESGDITPIIDMKQLMPSYYESCSDISSDELDWMHLNTIQSMGDDRILVSSRETSTIIQINDIYTNPYVNYMMGEYTYWQNSEYQNLLLDKEGAFPSQCGQHSINYIEDTTLPDGQYYLSMFNNNFGYSKTQSSYDWSILPGVATKTTAENVSSKYYQYLVDETTGTYELVDSFPVPYSAYISSAQEVGDNIIIDSGSKNIFGEYDSDHNLIRSFTLDHESFIYRVYKYDFIGFWFQK